MIKKVSAAGWSVLIIIGSLLPKSEIQRVPMMIFPHSDKLLHGTAYMVMTILWLLAIHTSSIRKRTRFAIFISTVGLGILIEILQSLLPIARDFEIFDIIANIFGSALGLILFITFIKQ